MKFDRFDALAMLYCAPLPLGISSGLSTILQTMQFNTRGKNWDFFAFLSGNLFLSAFSPYDYWYLAIPAITLLFISWHDVSAKRAALRGYLFGLGLFCPGLWWVYVSIHDFGGAGVIFAIFLSLLFASFWALFPALAGYLTVVCEKRTLRPFRLLIPATIWVLVEYFRGQLIFGGFPLYQLAYSQLDSPLSGFVPLSGVYGCSWVAALIASTLAYYLHNKSYYRLLLLVFPLTLVISGWLLTEAKWTHEIGPAIKVTMIQGNIDQNKKWQPKYRDPILKLYKEKTLEHLDSQLIIWPESSVPAFYQEIKDYYLPPLLSETQKHGTDLVISLPIRDEQQQTFNAVMSFGENAGVYKKIHLLPFGEYLPLESLFNAILGNMKLMPVGIFSPGSKQQALLEAAGYPFLTTICYEDAFGEESASRINKAAYLVNVTNDGWFGQTQEPYVHMQLARMRALETGRYLLRATNNGLTAIVAPDGKIIKQAPLFEVATLTGEIVPMSGYTPYVSLGDSLVLMLLILALSGALIRWIPTQKR